MPDEIEVPLEDAQDSISEAHERHKEAKGAEAGGGGGWMRFVGLATAILAVIAAIGALQSGVLVNEALIRKNDQVGLLTQASDRWSEYQAQRIKAIIYETGAQGQSPGSATANKDLAQSRHYQQKQGALQAQAQGLEADAKKQSDASDHFLEKHHVFAYSVSLCQIAIALSAVAALTRRPHIWFLGLGAGGLGLILLLIGFLRR